MEKGDHGRKEIVITRNKVYFRFKNYAFSISVHFVPAVEGASGRPECFLSLLLLVLVLGKC